MDRGGNIVGWGKKRKEDAVQFLYFSSLVSNTLWIGSYHHDLILVFTNSLLPVFPRLFRIPTMDSGPFCLLYLLPIFSFCFLIFLSVRHTIAGFCNSPPLFPRRVLSVSQFCSVG
uniref:Uncharacterized protein n=1 Tax=Trypanosoma congolense (strain IL3000) TaxID=1068625 RepID=G0UL41_TRYCI|nr:hypothetical protein, unlikely [Trypanosoma congolense IL3000]